MFVRKKLVLKNLMWKRLVNSMTLRNSKVVPKVSVNVLNWKSKKRA